MKTCLRCQLSRSIETITDPLRICALRPSISTLIFIRALRFLCTLIFQATFFGLSCTRIIHSDKSSASANRSLGSSHRVVFPWHGFQSESSWGIVFHLISRERFSHLYVLIFLNWPTTRSCLLVVHHEHSTILRTRPSSTLNC